MICMTGNLNVTKMHLLGENHKKINLIVEIPTKWQKMPFFTICTYRSSIAPISAIFFDRNMVFCAFSSSSID